MIVVVPTKEDVQSGLSLREARSDVLYKPLLSSLFHSKALKAILVSTEPLPYLVKFRTMQLTLPILLLAAPVLGNVFYDAPFIEEPGLVTRTISNGPHCVSTFQTHQDSTNPPHQCSELQAKLGSQVSFPGSATFIREQNDTALGYWSFQEQAVIPACRLTPKSTRTSPLLFRNSPSSTANSLSVVRVICSGPDLPTLQAV